VRTTEKIGPLVIRNSIPCSRMVERLYLSEWREPSKVVFSLTVRGKADAHRHLGSGCVGTVGGCAVWLGAWPSVSSVDICTTSLGVQSRLPKKHDAQDEVAQETGRPRLGRVYWRHAKYNHIHLPWNDPVMSTCAQCCCGPTFGEELSGVRT
jgi:hypothetical protein